MELVKKSTHPFEKIVIGMEPTGHYWKPLANYLIDAGYRVVGVNPYHTKKSKELPQLNCGLRAQGLCPSGGSAVVIAEFFLLLAFPVKEKGGHSLPPLTV